MSYEQFFGLDAPPFSLAPNPRYLFESASHAAALEQLASAIGRREPLIVMTGEIGTGKTLLCRTVLQRLDRKTFVSVINNPLLERDDLLKQMLQDFGVMSTDRATVPGTSRHDMVHALEDFLSSLIALGAHAVVIIDEAQHVQPDVLEQIRLLSNIDAPSGTMLQIILVGQQDLESLLARPDLRQFQQRVSRRIRLEPLHQDELRSYIDHRLAVGRATGSGLPGAGELARALVEWEGAKSGVMFTPDAVQAIWRWSSGIPRVVNLLCDHALEAACARKLRTIDAELVDTAAMALDLRAEPPAETTPPVPQKVDIHFTPIQPSLDVTPIQPSGDVDVDPAECRCDVDPAEWRCDVDPAEFRCDVDPAEFRCDADPAEFRVGHGERARAQERHRSADCGARRHGRGGGLVRDPCSSQLCHRFARRDACRKSGAARQAGGRPFDAGRVIGTGLCTHAGRSSPATAAPASPPPATSAPASAPAPSAPTARDAIVPSFEIIVASFRTEARAVSVAAQVADAGLKVRRRTIAGWQQVIAGPFASREEADAAHQRLERAGLPGTQIVAPSVEPRE